MDTSHAHVHGHGGGRVEVLCVGCLDRVLTWPLCRSILLLLPLLLHFHFNVFLLVLIRQLYLLLKDLSAQAAVGTFEAGLPDVGWRCPPVGHFVLWHSAVKDDRCVLVTVLVVFELVVICAIVFPGLWVVPLPVFCLVLFFPLRFSRSRGQMVPVVLRRPIVAKEADGVDRDWWWMAQLTLLCRVPRNINKVPLSVPVAFVQKKQIKKTTSHCITSEKWEANKVMLIWVMLVWSLWQLCSTVLDSPVLVVLTDWVSLVRLSVSLVGADWGAPLRVSGFQPGWRCWEGGGGAVEAVPRLLVATVTAACWSAAVRWGRLYGRIVSWPLLGIQHVEKQGHKLNAYHHISFWCVCVCNSINLLFSITFTEQ